jgi:DNA-binding response OmpR family regulator
MAAARVNPPDVLVLDPNMPQLDGSEVLESWAASTELKDVPVLLVSARPELVQVVKRYQVRAILTKPFDMDVLCAVIEQLLAHPEPPADG